MKKAPSDSVIAGDWVYRAGSDGDEYMMIVESAADTIYQGIAVRGVSGKVYVMTGEGAGPTGAFLGRVRLDLAGVGEWYFPLGASGHQGLFSRRSRGTLRRAARLPEWRSNQPPTTEQRADHGHRRTSVR